MVRGLGSGSGGVRVRRAGVRVRVRRAGVRGVMVSGAGLGQCKGAAGQNAE